MTTMTHRNPYVAPRAAVSDASEEFQPVRVFAVSGRIGRLRYIFYTMGVPFVIMLLAGIGSALLGPAGAALTVVAWIAVVGVSITLTIQRSHDFNMSGWFALLWLVPLANLAFWFIPGTDGPNRFGGKTPPNGVGLILSVLMVPVVIVAILAAVAVPAYQDYVKRAQAYEQRR
jgi:uncharacterized membrane protein YhaH (DUF805 family)